MKLNKLLSMLIAGVMVGSVSTTMTSCDNDDDDNWYIVQVGAAYNISYNAEGYWDKCYQTDPVAKLTLGPVEFSHDAKTSEWGGSWKGFCPSRSTDNKNYPADDRWMYQWGSITGGDVQGAGVGYMLACWDVQEDTRSIPANPSLKISMTNGIQFTPGACVITNTAYAYYTMKEGNSFSEPFDALSYMQVNFIGVLNGRQTGHVTFYLARDGKILDKWTTVDLSALGKVDYIYCQMESSDSGQWGMNTPAYFCLDNLTMSFE